MIEKENILSFLIFLLILFIMLFIGSACAKKADANGDVEFSNSYNSTDRTEKLNFSLGYANKKDKVEIQFNNKMNKEVQNDELDRFTMKSLMQANYYSKTKYYYYANVGYERNTSIGIDDSNKMGIGYGNKDILGNNVSYYIQSGLASKAIFYEDDEMDRSTYLTMAGGISFPFAKSLILSQGIGVDQDIVSLDDDQGTVFESDTMVSADINKSIYLAIAFEYEYQSKKVEGFPQDQRLYLSKIGIRF